MKMKDSRENITHVQETASSLIDMGSFLFTDCIQITIDLPLGSIIDIDFAYWSISPFIQRKHINQLELQKRQGIHKCGYNCL